MGARNPHRRPGREGPTSKGQSQLDGYYFLIDTCDVRQWTPLLDFDPESKQFTLCIREGKKIIARATSESEAPEALAQVATGCRESLELGRKLTG